MSGPLEMLSIGIEQDNDEILYITLDHEAKIAQSSFPDERVTLDYDKEGVLIGVEIIGSDMSKEEISKRKETAAKGVAKKLEYVRGGSSDPPQKD